MTPRREAGSRIRLFMVGVFAVLAVVLAPVSAPAVEGEIRGLLRELWIQVPSREAPAPEFALPDLNGSPVRLSQYRGRPLMLYFWTTW